jgi:hypothetical protein
LVKLKLDLIACATAAACVAKIQAETEVQFQKCRLK